MSRASDIISRALQDRFNPVANPINIARDFGATLDKLVRAANHVFEACDRSVGSPWHYIMDINEASLHSPLRPDGKKHMVLFASLHDTCTSDMRSRLVQTPEPGMILKFGTNGQVIGTTVKSTICYDSDKEPKIARGPFQFHASQRQKQEDFVASWLRANLDAKTLVAIQAELDRQDEKDAEAFWLWTPQQLERLKAKKANLVP